MERVLAVVGPYIRGLPSGCVGAGQVLMHWGHIFITCPNNPLHNLTYSFALASSDTFTTLKIQAVSINSHENSAPTVFPYSPH
jgi:hypothetical protein